MYANGRGVPEDDREAAFWWRQAAEQGDADAQFNLGLMYRLGEGVPRDDVQGYAWLILAAAQGSERSERARTIIRQIRQGMTPARIVEAQKLSHELVAWIADGRSVPAPARISGTPVRPPEPSRDTVRQVQAYLALLGYDPGPVDGLPGRRTTAAVLRFQQVCGGQLLSGPLSCDGGWCLSSRGAERPAPPLPDPDVRLSRIRLLERVTRCASGVAPDMNDSRRDDGEPK